MDDYHRSDDEPPTVPLRRDSESKPAEPVSRLSLRHECRHPNAPRVEYSNHANRESSALDALSRHLSSGSVSLDSEDRRTL
jgi:hypothetical protein